MSDPVNTKTTLAPGTGGSDMDESLVTLSDGTQVHRTRVAVAFHVGDEPGARLVTPATPLPTADGEALELLRGILGELKLIRILLKHRG